MDSLDSLLESLNSPQIPDAFWREEQRLTPDGSRVTRTAQYKRGVCVRREMDS